MGVTFILNLIQDKGRAFTTQSFNFYQNKKDFKHTVQSLTQLFARFIFL